MISIFRGKKKEPENIKEVLNYIKKLEKEVNELKGDLEVFRKEGRKFLSKTALVRYNPFKEIGGEQSFSVALLDADNNGFIITSLQGKDVNRVYAKPIEGGKSKYQLSNEEKEVLARAAGSK